MAKFEFNDVANYQPDSLAYFQGLKSKGSGAVIVKITEYVNYINPKATNQVINADKAGLRTAGYHFARFGGNVTQAHQEAAFFIAQSKARLAKGSILALDYEANASGNKASNTDAIIAFMQDIKNAGFTPWFYSGKYYITPNVDHARVNKAFPNTTWIAGYPGTSYPDFNYFPALDGVVAWQYTDNWKGLGVDGSTMLLDWKEGSVAPKPSQVKKVVKSLNPDQVLHVGEHFKARPAYRVDEMKYVNGMWQVVNYGLAGGKPINWTLNGFAVDSVDKVDSKGKKTANQTLAVGNYFRLHSDRIPVVAVSGNGIALGTRHGNVWVDAGTLTEVK